MPDTSLTTAQYETLQGAYQFFNTALFTGALPDVLVTLQRQANARGYFSPSRFTGRARSTQAHELALNPDAFTDRTDEQIFSTLVHEMAHVWQETYGNAPRRCYHDREWATKMRSIGLQPTSTGEQGGKETGQNVTHYIIADGPFQIACRQLAGLGFRIDWQSAPADKTAKAKKASKTKFTCPDCGLNAWAKPDAQLICGDCYDDGNGDIVVLLGEVDQDA